MQNLILAAGETMKNPSGSFFQRGVTLIELMTALCIAIVITTLAAPDLTDFIQQVRLSGVAHELQNAILLTRSEAVRHNGIVDLHAVNNQWENGWIISGTDQKPLLIHARLHADFKINARLSDGYQHIAYNGTGRSLTRSNGNATQFGHIELTLGRHSRKIQINFLGRTRMCDPLQEKAC